MDDLAHHFPLNHRKRKAESDDPQDSSTPDPVVAADQPVILSGPSTAPRQPWLASGSEWPTPSSPQASSPLSAEVMMFSTYPTKRPRLEKIETALRATKRPLSRKSAVKTTPSRPPPTVRHGNDMEDLGVVSTADPGPSTGSLLHLRPGPKSPDPSSPSAVSLLPIDTNSIHIPSLQPLVNRQTLKELDLDVILRNPQLRHDLLFDPGLQFRPTCSRRKRGISERYWAAIAQEVETGCTCVSFDLQGKPHTTVCACAQVPNPPSHPVVAYSSAMNVVTLRMPSRIRNLLSEFLEVLLLVVQPLSSVSGMYVNPNTFKSQMQEHSAQAAYIRYIFDPALIEQELKHELFDPSGLFCAIGSILKGHCAPMRDRAVEMMVQAAKACAPGGTGSKRDAVSAVRMCMEILELMKLDIANHQLQTLMPFLMRTSAQFELKAFKNRENNITSLRMTREWLHLAHTDMLSRPPIPHPRHFSGSLSYSALPRNSQTYLAVLKGIIDLIFDPPPPSSSPSSTPTSSTPPSPVFQTTTLTSPRLPGYPETTYLDSARLALLSSDAADTTALYMFLLLYRQLIHSESNDPASSPQDSLKVDDADLLRLKKEIRDIGPTHLGSCFSCGSAHELDNSNEKNGEEGRFAKRDIVLQIAKRAKDAQCSRANPSLSSSSPPPSPIGEIPGEQMVNLAQRWADANIQPDSPLCTMLRRRLRDAVFNAVVVLTYPGRDSTTGALSTVDFLSFVHASVDPLAIPLSTATATGMEPLVDEIRSLAEKISRLALIHLNAFLPLYEQDGFLE
ncbi:Protein SOK1 [Hypsizygus marmoreus]|uniref:Protein SOK1 n=1 Tax=Hypsizygus marmoreus TaxID=39966 RepID=A0A369J9X9_HYPMA|nr:Protein SOK1 [Hypsizygus marmoreus]